MGASEALKDTLHLIDAHVEVLHDATVEHGSGHVSSTALFLRLMEDPKHNPFGPREPIAHVGNQRVGVHGGILVRNSEGRHSQSMP